MTPAISRSNRMKRGGLVVMAFSVILSLSANAVSAPLKAPVNAIYLESSLPDQRSREKAVAAYRESGATVVIVRPVSEDGKIDRRALGGMVSAAHSAGFKLFAIIPTRAMPYLLDQHPAWEDRHFDLESRSAEASGRLDLFNPSAIAYLIDLCADIAALSVDGILLDQDFFYGPTEAMSSPAMHQYKQKFGSSFSTRTAFGRIDDEGEDSLDQVGKYGDDFWNLAELKKNALQLVLKNLMQSAREKNKDIVFGIPLHPQTSPDKKHLLAKYSYDLSSLKRTSVDCFWMPVPHRELMVRRNINYQKSVEMIARMVGSASLFIDQPSSIIFILQTVGREGRPLPLSEIEEVSTLINRAGNKPGIAFMVRPDASLPPSMTQKIFSRKWE